MLVPWVTHVLAQFVNKSNKDKIQNIETLINNTNSRISVITTDLESLLNNDKLLLDKLIEKNIVSTI